MDFIFAISSDKPRAKETIPITSPNLDKEKIQAEYSKVWLEQSKLLWSRLQTAYVLHAGVFSGWFVLFSKDYALPIQIGILGIGILLSVFLWLIMRRDGKCMDSIKIFCGTCISEPANSKALGRKFAYSMLFILGLAEFLLGLFLIVYPDAIKHA